MPIQNNHEIQQLVEVSEKLEHAARHAQNNADPQELQHLQTQLREVQNKIQDARGKAINGSGTSTEPLFEAQLRVEQSQEQMERVLNNLNIQQDNVQP
ncbi:hypothetical protein GH741_01765 [Aquibacillus halophilus]|uniref:DUF2524 family protein n=1 Tax=Aquibacillus halophilus TaxID=930132 RepID=A0A6A8D726_9BACI|nr:hypothetical protein [Aquibacillus halophilus]MRH41398.1 hypothetical protein [Aquibacillus halophilus]